MRYRAPLPGAILGGSGDTSLKFSANLRTNPTLSQGTLQLACQRADPTNRIRSLGDYEGLTRYAVANEAVWEGYRRVENLYPTATDAPTSQTVTMPVMPMPNSQRRIVISFTGSGSVSWTGTTAGSPLAGIDASTRVGTTALTVNAATIVFTLAGDVRFIQIEETTGQVLNTAPSEYVSRGTLATPYHGPGVDGVQYFTTTNGNSLSVKTVVAGTGTTLSTIRGLSGFPQNTQIVWNTEDYSTTWTNVGSPTKTANSDSCGLVSLTNIEDTGGAELQGITQTISGIASTTQGNGVKFHFKKSVANATSQACFRVRNTTTSTDLAKYMIEWPGTVTPVTNVLANGVAGVAGTSTVSASVPIPVGTVLLVICVPYSTQTTGTQRTITAVTGPGGVEAMINVPGAAGWSGAGGDSGGGDILYYVNPTSGTQTVTATLSANVDQAWLAYTCWTGVDTTLPMQFLYQSAATTANNSELPACLNAGDVSIDCMFSGFVAAGPTLGNGTLIYYNRPNRSGGAQYNTVNRRLMTWGPNRPSNNFTTMCNIRAARSSPGTGSTPYLTALAGTFEYIETKGNGAFEFWGRTIPTTNTGNTHIADFYPATDSALAVGNTGGMQIGAINVQTNNQGYDVPAPYIPTGGANITRPFDSYTADLSGWWNNTQGTMVAEVEYFMFSTNYSWQAFTTTNERYIKLRRFATGGSYGQVAPLMRQAGGEQLQLLAPLPYAENGSINREVYGYKALDFGFAINGGTPITLSTVTLPALGAANTQLFAAGGSPSIGGTADTNICGYMREYTYYNVKKTTAQIQTLSVYP